MSEPIYHLARADDWNARTDVYLTSGFDREGFIHCSTADQIDDVALSLYRGQTDLTLIAIDAESLGDAVVYEEGTDGAEVFPHVYQPIPMTAVVAAEPYLKHLEHALWNPDTRFDREWMDQIMHAGFTEVGRSGRVHSRSDILETPPRPFAARIDDYRQDTFSPDVVMVRYTSTTIVDGVSARGHRTSIWVRSPAGWRLRFHQGTPAADRGV